MPRADGEAVRTDGEARFSAHRLSWVAYVGPCVTLAVVLPVTWLISHWSIAFAVLLLAFALFWYVLRILFLYSVEIFTDIDGVWIFRGIFPWSRGVYGVKWRDVDEATYYTGLISWTTKSYRIRIAHRFTKSSEIVISHVRRGDEAVQFINRLHQDVVRRLDVAAGSST